MSSTNFDNAVTVIPADWANDVNRLVYSIFGAPANLAQVQSLLGLAPVLSGGAFTVINGTVNGTEIGGSQPSGGTFTRVRVTGSNSGLTDVVTHAQLASAVSGATGLIKDMAYQEATAVAIEGGAIDGVNIGGSIPGPGVFTTLKANNPVSGTDVVNIQTLNTRFSALPTFGSMASQVHTAVDINGGYIDNTIIGANTPVEAAFTRITTEQILGSTCHTYLDGAAPGLGQYALLFDLISEASLDLGFKLKAGAAVEFTSPDGDLVFQDGRMTINATDDGIHELQVGGSIIATSVSISNLVPAAGTSLVSKSWVDTQIANVSNSIAPAITNAITALGDITSQDADSVNISGGAIDGVVIGGTTPALGGFTQVNTDLVNGSHGNVRLDGTGGYSNSAAIVSANDSLRPNISVIPNTNGVFAVMAGSIAVHRTHVSGRTIVGAGSDDGVNMLQVQGDAVVNGRLTLNGGVMTGGTAALELGTTAPAVMSVSAPHWVRVRVETVSGVRECVMPAWEVM